LCLYSINPSMLCNIMYRNMIMCFQHCLSLSFHIIQVSWLLYNIPSFTVLLNLENPSLHFEEDWNSTALSGLFRSACEEDERINQSLSVLCPLCVWPSFFILSPLQMKVEDKETRKKGNTSENYGMKKKYELQLR